MFLYILCLKLKMFDEVFFVKRAVEQEMELNFNIEICTTEINSKA